MRIKKGDGSKKSSSLRKQMIFYFLLIAIANIFVAGQFIWEIHSKSYRAQVIQDVNEIKSGQKPVEHIYTTLDKISRKFVIMTFILIVFSAVVLFLFVVQIATPIQYMINQASKMSEGDLSIRIEIKSNDEIAVLGNLINDLSINFQEVLAQLERMVHDLEKLSKVHKHNIKQFPNIRSYFDEESEIMERIIKEFKLLKDTYILFTIDSMLKNLNIEKDDEFNVDAVR